jgi:hypothetical protein
VAFFKRNQAQVEYHQLRARIDALENEVGILEGLGQGSKTATGFDRSLTNLRANLATQGLTAKRQELTELKAQADALLARDPRVAEPLPPPKPPAPPRDPRRTAIIGGAALLLILGAAIVGWRVLNPPPREMVSFLVAPLLESRVSTPGNLFYTSAAINVPYDGGEISISGDPVPTGKFAIDDRIVLSVKRPDGTTESWEHVFNDNCFRNLDEDAQDLTSMFQKGLNVVTVELHDVCGGAAGTSGPVFLTIH